MTTVTRDPQQVWLGGAVLAVAVVSVVVWRSLQSVSAPLAAAPATVDLIHLTAYLAPVTDSAAVASAALDTSVVPRDPFGSAPAAEVITAGPDDTVAQPAKTQASHWIVNAVLITGSYRAAVINDALVTLGGKFGDGARVTEIERDHVVVTDARGAKRTITVRDGNSQ